MTTIDPTTAFCRALSEFGLHPVEILWDRRIHHFPGKGKNEKNKSAWYIAFEDRSGGMFGDYSQGLDKTPWQMKRDRDPTPAERQEWARKDAEAAKRQAAARARAASEVQAAWKAAVPANTAKTHPYLEAKHIDRGVSKIRVLKKGTPGLKILGEEYTVPQDILLIPMRKEKQLVNVQRIIGSSKRYWPGAEVVGAFCAVGGEHFKENKTLYLCEGWATAWSISECMKAVCLVAFNTGGLLPVAERIRKKYGKVKLIIAADNDRWSSLSDDTPNPGVWYATQAAKNVNARVAIPDFKDLSTKPTDFNDLHHLEGIQAVREWLNPKYAERAVTVTDASPDPEDEVGGSHRHRPFRCLGVNKSVYHYLPNSHGQIVSIGAPSHANRMNLIQLADLEWWGETFPFSTRKTGVDWTRAAASLQAECHAVGVFHPGLLRGRGCWRDDDDRVLLHLGDRLLPPQSNQFVKPEGYRAQGKIYPRHAHLAGPSEDHAMKVEEAKSILDLFASRAWDDEASGYLLAGWTVLAPFCGALKWRPHVWLAGSSGSGKTTIIRRMVFPLLGGMGLYAEGSTTEAGIRQQLGSDALPVIYDEAERTTGKADSQIQGVVRLARTASSTGARIYKGTQSGHAMNFKNVSMFLLSSISVGLRQEADKTRVAVLSLKSAGLLDPVERKRDWAVLTHALDKHFTEANGRRLLARTAKWLRTGKFDDLHRIVRSAANGVLGDARAADQYGALAAGTWTLMTDDLPPESEVIDWFQTRGITTYVDERLPEGHKIISKLLQAREFIGTPGEPVSVGELIDIVAQGESERQNFKGPVNYKRASGALKRLGMRVRRQDGAAEALLVANQSVWVEDQLRNTLYADGWVRVLRTIEGAKVGPTMRFSGEIATSRTTVIPFSSIMRD